MRDSKEVLKIKDLLANGRYLEALKYCIDIKEDRILQNLEYLKIGYECKEYPEFYRSLGYSPELEYANSIDMLISLYKI